MARKFSTTLNRFFSGLVIASILIVHSTAPVFAAAESNLDLAECAEGDDKCVENNVNMIKQAVSSQQTVQLNCDDTYGCDEMKKALEESEAQNRKNLKQKPGYRDKQFQSDNFITFYDPSCGDSSAGAVSDSGAGDPLPDTVPEPWRTLINNAAAEHPDSDRRIVAATLWAENRGWPEYKDSDSTTSGAAAVGFWQFIPSTWAVLGHDGDGDGIKDSKNPKDAVHAAFKHSPNSAGKPIIYEATGDIEGDFTSKKFYRADESKYSLLTYMANYNGNDGSAIEGSTLPNFQRAQNGDYVRMGYWLMASGFEKGWLPEADKFVDASTQGAGAAGGDAADADVSATNVSDASCSSGSSSSSQANAEGFAWPIDLKKDDVVGFPCIRDNYCGHHDGSPAFDLIKKSNGDQGLGVAVYAVRNGKIESKDIRNGISYCYDWQLAGDDGYWYWYGHNQNPSIENGQVVKAGQQIGEVGPTECADGSVPHLHIDRGSPKGSWGGSVNSRDSEFVPIMQKLWEDLGGTNT